MRTKKCPNRITITIVKVVLTSTLTLIVRKLSTLLKKNFIIIIKVMKMANMIEWSDVY